MRLGRGHRGSRNIDFPPRSITVVDRVINVWNALPSTANCTSLNFFKNSIEKTVFFWFSCLFVNILLV